MPQFKETEALIFAILWAGDHSTKKKKVSWEDYHNHLISC